jgi:hypothetical protein
VGGEDEGDLLVAQGLVDLGRGGRARRDEALEGPVGGPGGGFDLGEGRGRERDEERERWLKMDEGTPSPSLSLLQPLSPFFNQLTSPTRTARSCMAVEISSDRLCRLSRWEKAEETLFDGAEGGGMERGGRMREGR